MNSHIGYVLKPPGTFARLSRRAWPWRGWVPGIALCLLAGFSLAARAAGGGDVQPPKNREFQFVIENDWLSNTDRYYTNGFKIGLGRQFEPLQKPLEDFLQDVAPKYFKRDADTQFGLFLGHNIYTPRDIRIAAPQPNDRPWAAWLYLGGVLQRANDERHLDTLELDLGIVGAAAGGRWVQTEWHRFIGAPEPKGWDNQLPSEPGVQLSYIRKRRFGSNTVDVVPHVGAALGSVMTFVRVGGMLRLGYNMESFGTDTIEPGGVILQNTRRRTAANEGFVFLDIDHRLVGRNVFLDGTLLHDSPSVQKRTHVYDIKIGAALRFGPVRFSVTRVRRSEEFHTTVGGAGGPQTFHSFNIGLELP